MNREAFTFQVSNASYLIAAAFSTALPLLLGPRLENWFGGIGTAAMFGLIVLGIFFFIRAIRPLQVLLLPDGLQIGEQNWKRDEITHVEFNERYRQIGVKAGESNRTAYYYLKRKAEIPLVSQALKDWAKKTGVTVDFKNSWR